MSAVTGAEGVGVSQWVTSALTGSQALLEALGSPPGGLASRVWEGTAPAGTPTPYLTFVVGEGLDTGGVGMARFQVTLPVVVRAVTAGESYAPLVPVVHAADEALHGALNVPTALGATILTCTRQGTLQYPERADGLEYRHLGGTYNVVAQ